MAICCLSWRQWNWCRISIYNKDKKERTSAYHLGQLKLPETTTNSFFDFSPLSMVSEFMIGLSSSLFNGTNGIFNDLCLDFWPKNFLIVTEEITHSISRCQQTNNNSINYYCSNPDDRWQVRNDKLFSCGLWFCLTRVIIGVSCIFSTKRKKINI